MSELRRWSADGATDAEIALLEAARGVQPSAETLARARALRALSVTAAATTIAGAAPVAAATKSGLTLVGKIAILSLVGGGVVAGGVAVRAARQASAPPAAAVVPAPRPVSAVPLRPEPPRVNPPPASVSAPISPVRAAESPRPARPASSNDQLSREVKALELAHRALAEHDPQRALELLDRYGAHFPAGSLSSEAVVLRVQALLANGDRAAAQAQADAYSAAHPDTPFAIRLKELVRGQ